MIDRIHPSTTAAGILAQARANIKPATRLAAEVEEGNHEYKFKLSNMTTAQVNHRISQLQWRLNEGNDEAVYHIGVEDNGYPLGLTDLEMQESLQTLLYMAQQADCDMRVRQLYQGINGLTAEVCMRRRERLTLSTSQLSLALVGDVGAGKSTLVGVLRGGKLDNGRGLARSKVFTHNHELVSGHTSCIAHTLLHFGSDGEILNADAGPAGRLRALSDMELAMQTVKSVNLIDLAGHAKYLKTTLHGLVARPMDRCLVVISAVQGVTSTTLEHLLLAHKLLCVPLCIVITQADNVLPHSSTIVSTAVTAFDDICAQVPALERIRTALHDFLTTSSSSSTTTNTSTTYELVLINTLDALHSWLAHTTNHDADNNEDGKQSKCVQIPVFLISNVTGEGLTLFRRFLCQLPCQPTQQHSLVHTPAQKDTTTALPGKVAHVDGAVQLKKEGQEGTGDCYVRLLGAIGCSPDEAEDEEDDNEDDEDEDVYIGSGKHQKEGQKHAGQPKHDKNNHKQSHYQRYLDSEKGQQETAAQHQLLRQKQEQRQQQLLQQLHLQQLEDDVDESLVSSMTSVCSSQHSSQNHLSTLTSTPSKASIAAAVSNEVHSHEEEEEDTEALRIYEDALQEFADWVDTSAPASTSNKTTRKSSPTTSPTTSPSSTNFASNATSKVLVGQVLRGRLQLHATLVLGPTSQGHFVPVYISSLRLHNVNVKYVVAGQTATFRLSRLSRTATARTVRHHTNATLVATAGHDSSTTTTSSSCQKRSRCNGLVLLSATHPSSTNAVAATCCWEFVAALTPSPSSATTTISPSVAKAVLRTGCEVVAHIHGIRQSVRVLAIDKQEQAQEGERDGDELCAGECGLVRFRFVYWPEFVCVQDLIVLRDDRVKALGRVAQLVPITT